MQSVAPLSAVSIVRRAPVGSASQIFRSAISHDVAVATAGEAGHVSWRWLTDALAGVFVSPCYCCTSQLPISCPIECSHMLFEKRCETDN